MSGSRPSHTAASLRRRAAILDVARELIAERGVDKLVIADVAERADVSVATIYNLVGTRDRLLIALLDDVAQQVRTRLGQGSVPSGVDACLHVIRTACDTVLDDADTVRAIVANVGNAAPDQWLADGLESSIKRSVDAAVVHGDLGAELSPVAVVIGIQLGFRGALISWVFGLLPDEQLTANAEYMTLHILANAATPGIRPEIDQRLVQLAIHLTGDLR